MKAFMLALFSRFFPRLRPDGVRALKNRPDNFAEYELWERSIVAEIDLHGNRRQPITIDNQLLELTCGHRVLIHANRLQRLFCEQCYVASQSANAGKPQPANEPAEERQKPNDSAYIAHGGNDCP